MRGAAVIGRGAGLVGLMAGGRDRRRLAARMGALHGLPQKIGQLLALSELESGDRVFSELTQGGEALSPKKAARAIDAALGRPAHTVFSELSLDGIPASLGQVHRATLWDGRHVAVKLQYPGIADAVKVDLGALGWVGQVFRRGYDLRAYREVVGEMIARELDYRLEAQALTHFGARIAGDSTFHAPTLIPDLSTEQLLVMSWVDGLTLDELRARPLEVRQSAARGLIRLFLRSVLEWGLVHGDLHAGNLRFTEVDGAVRVGLLDFGCVQSLDGSTAGGLRLLFEGVTRGGPPSHWLARYEALGFSRTLLEPVVSDLEAVTRLLLEPLLTDGAFDAATWALNTRFQLLLGERRFAFRFAAPASFLFVTRAFVTLVQTLKALDAPVAWRPVLDEVLNQSTVSAPPELELVDRRAPVAPLRSKHLRVRVNAASGTRIDLTFPARATENLEGLIPPEILPRLAARGIDAAALARAALDQACAPGPLFELNEPARAVTVWLE